MPCNLHFSINVQPTDNFKSSCLVSTFIKVNYQIFHLFSSLSDSSKSIGLLIRRIYLCLWHSKWQIHQTHPTELFKPRNKLHEQPFTIIQIDTTSMIIYISIIYSWHGWVSINQSWFADWSSCRWWNRRDPCSPAYWRRPPLRSPGWPPSRGRYWRRRGRCRRSMVLHSELRVWC